MSKFTLAGIVNDSTSKVPVPDLEVFLYETATSKQLASTTTDSQGTWTFSVDPGDYIVGGSLKSTLPSETTAVDSYSLSCYRIAIVGANITNVALEATPIKGVLRTPANDANYINAVYKMVQEQFEEQTKTATSLSDVAEAAASAQATLAAFLAPFMANRSDDDKAKEPPASDTIMYPCAQCTSICYGSSDPNCLTKCRLGPPPCT